MFVGSLPAHLRKEGYGDLDPTGLTGAALLPDYRVTTAHAVESRPKTVIWETGPAGDDKNAGGMGPDTPDEARLARVYLEYECHHLLSRRRSCSGLGARSPLSPGYCPFRLRGNRVGTAELSEIDGGGHG